MKAWTLEGTLPGLKALRTQRGLSIGDVAHCLEVSWGTVRKWDDCESAPRCVNLVKLAHLFHTTPDALLEYEVEPVQQLRRVK